MKADERRKTRAHQAQVGVVVEILEDLLLFFRGRVITGRAVALISTIYSLKGQMKEYDQELEEQLKYKPRRKKKKK